MQLTNDKQNCMDKAAVQTQVQSTFSSMLNAATGNPTT